MISTTDNEREINVIERAEYEAWCEENRDGLDRSRVESTDTVVVLLRDAFPNFQALWDSGCWLKVKLMSLGCSEELARATCFAHGQRCVFGDPVEIALGYVNEYADSQSIQDKPGVELGNKLCGENI